MSDPMDAIFWRDELLQIMYWFRGEGFGDAITPRDLATFLSADQARVQGHLERLVADGYATRRAGVPDGYQLTEMGVQEGGRRFADEFAGLTGQAHGECNNPSCACQTQGPAACVSRTARPPARSG